ncbi:MAG TPA: FkbM family methyltransferase [Blastocatellia bacterium]|nr:FkbM family methyltransferase [Blastocatellia bacterium]
MNSQVVIAESEKCRKPTALEHLGARLGLGRLPMRSLLKRAYHFALNLQAGGGGLRCTLPEGETLRILPGCRYVSWNRDEYNAFKSLLPTGGVALDIGANVGCYSLLFGQWVGPSGKVFAFEPASETCENLRRHIKLNRLDAVVTAVEAAVSDANETASFLKLDNQGMNRLALSSEQAEAARVVRVATTTVDRFCEQAGVVPDLIKIDVEGFELNVLRGARETIKAMGERPALFVEIHPTTWREIGLSKDDFVRELERQNLKAVSLRPAPDLWAVEGECLRLVRG